MDISRYAYGAPPTDSNSTQWIDNTTGTFSPPLDQTVQVTPMLDIENCEIQWIYEDCKVKVVDKDEE